jgi:uncharacterized protein
VRFATVAPGKEWAVKLDLSEIARTPGSYAELPIDRALADLEGMTLTAPVRGKMTTSSTGRVLLLEGKVDTEVEMACFRCGGTYRQPVHAEFQEDFMVRLPQGQGQGQGPMVDETEEAPETRLFFEGTMDLNLDELLRQNILLALPVKPLCAEDCCGLCQRCGARLGEEECGCDAEPERPHWDALRSLMEHRNREEPTTPKS